MDTPLKYVIGVLTFWLMFGGLLQIFDMDNYSTGNTINVDSDKNIGIGLSKLSFIWDLITFQIQGIPSALSLGLTTFFTSSLVLSIYVLLRSGS